MYVASVDGGEDDAHIMFFSVEVGAFARVGDFEVELVGNGVDHFLFLYFGGGVQQFVDLEDLLYDGLGY